MSIWGLLAIIGIPLFMWFMVKSGNKKLAKQENEAPIISKAKPTTKGGTGMKIDIERTEVQKGLLFKKTEFQGRVKVALGESEHETVKQLFDQKVRIEGVMIFESKRGAIDRDYIELFKGAKNGEFTFSCYVNDNTTRDGFIETVKDSLVQLSDQIKAVQASNSAPANESFEL